MKIIKPKKRNLKICCVHTIKVTCYSVTHHHRMPPMLSCNSQKHTIIACLTSNAYYKFASIQLHVLFLQLPNSDVWSTWGISILGISWRFKWHLVCWKWRLWILGIFYWVWIPWLSILDTKDFIILLASPSKRSSSDYAHCCR